MSDGVVDLEHCWKWKCPECDEQNIADMVPAELLPDERQEMAEELGIEDMPGVFMTNPSHVTCMRCFEEFKTRIPEGPEE